MIKEFIVSNKNNGEQEPIADENIWISSKKGISFADSLVEGDYTFSVDFEDHKIYEHMLGHDINLVKIENESQLDSLNSWINVTEYSAFKTPAPNGLKFLGGVEDLFGDNKGYFHVSFKNNHKHRTFNVFSQCIYPPI